MLAVSAGSDHFAPNISEFLDAVTEGNDLSGALEYKQIQTRVIPGHFLKQHQTSSTYHKGEIQGVEEKHDIFSLVVREFDLLELSIDHGVGCKSHQSTATEKLHLGGKMAAERANFTRVARCSDVFSAPFYPFPSMHVHHGWHHSIAFSILFNMH
eukprot:gb/GECG01016046.1/.p1 GENE.gb/GECG01016046.1/~~gb/GECG01016046.1/.p1  ORF type:complete len:155 (+),score=13.19 gb/GECG01016046.1/:1-465(+)